MDEQGAPHAERAKRGFTPGRIALWVLVGGIGAYLVVSGIVGIFAKG